jgi:hypothetical protein
MRILDYTIKSKGIINLSFVYSYVSCSRTSIIWLLSRYENVTSYSEEVRYVVSTNIVVHSQ